VETLAAVPRIVHESSVLLAEFATVAAAGTKIFSLSGPILRPGVVEVRIGCTLGTLLEQIGGGLKDPHRTLRAAIVGGPSGTVVPSGLFDRPMLPRERVSPGTGGVVAVPDDTSIVDVVRALLSFNVSESCGKCTPCREGLPRLLAMVDGFREEATGIRAITEVRKMAETIRQASLCGLGQAAPLALIAALETFPADFGISEVRLE
jgi:NADH:ubiquinone oxidoreductase subunit F (NADH-binding)